MKKDSIEEHLRSKLRDYELPLDTKAGWQRLEQVLSASAPAAPPRRLWMRPLATAAAVLIAFVALGAYLWQNRPEGADTVLSEVEKRMQPQIQQPETERTHEQTQPERVTPQPSVVRTLASMTLREAVADTTHPIVRPDTIPMADRTAVEPGTDTPAVIPIDPVLPDDTFTNMNTSPADDPDKSAAQITGTKGKNQRTYSLTSSGKRHRNRSWTASAFSTAPTGQTTNSPVVRGNALYMAHANFAVAETNFLTKQVTGSGIKHDFPLSYGITVRKRFHNQIGVETGLVYTYMSSKTEMDAAFHYKYRQKLHYLGIPLNISYRFAQWNNLEFYAYGGGMIERNLSARYTMRIYSDGQLTNVEKNDLSANGFQWSVQAGAGVAYQFIPQLGIYAEPGVNYYFQNHSQPESYRTDHNTSFNLRLGLRTTF